MKNFVEKWADKNLGKEKQDSHIFWIEFIKLACKEPDPEKFLYFESPVYLSKTSFLDIWIPESKVIIEQKSRGKSLEKPELQSDGSLLNPYEQAKRYDDNRPYSEKARWIITCNFDEFWIYNMDLIRPEKHVIKIFLKDLERDSYRLNFLVDARKSKITSEEQVSSIAGELVENYREYFSDYVKLPGLFLNLGQPKMDIKIF